MDHLLRHLLDLDDLLERLGILRLLENEGANENEGVVKENEVVREIEREVIDMVVEIGDREKDHRGEMTMIEIEREVVEDLEKVTVIDIDLLGILETMEEKTEKRGVVIDLREGMARMIKKDEAAGKKREERRVVVVGRKTKRTERARRRGERRGKVEEERLNTKKGRKGKRDLIKIKGDELIKFPFSASSPLFHLQFSLICPKCLHVCIIIEKKG